MRVSRPLHHHPHSDMSGVPAPAAPAPSVVALRRPLPLYAAAMIFAGMLGWVSALLVDPSYFSDDGSRVVGWSTLALVFAGLVLCCVSWQRWQQQDAIERAAAAKLDLFHALMSQSNRLIIRRPDPSQLFDGICQVCISQGQVDLALVHMPGIGEAHRAKADVISARFAAASPRLLLDGAKLQTLLMNLVVRTGEAIVVDDAATDERLSEGRFWCLVTGLFSLAVLPLRRGGSLVGMLCLCSQSKEFFDTDVMALLSELACDLSFAFDNADLERDRQSALMTEHSRLAAERADRARTEFLARMSHEIRTPLNAMLGFAQLLALDKQHALSTTQANRVRLISNAGWHLLGLVDEVMDTSRIEAKRFEVNNTCGDISSVLDEALALTQPLAHASKVELSEQQPSKFGIGAVVDSRRLLQVLLNLLSNACKYNRPGGRVRVDVTHAGAEVILDIVDNGVGMTKENLSDIQGHHGNAIEGAGIGLTLARQLVQLMKGRLEIESSPEAGTRARVVLPSCAIPLRAANDESDSHLSLVPSDSPVPLQAEEEEHATPAGWPNGPSRWN